MRKTIDLKFDLGDKVRDIITGYCGTITSISFSINSPTQYCVEGMDTTNRPINVWTEEDRLVYQKQKNVNEYIKKKNIDADALIEIVEILEGNIPIRSHSN